MQEAGKLGVEEVCLLGKMGARGKGPGQSSGGGSFEGGIGRRRENQGASRKSLQGGVRESGFEYLRSLEDTLFRKRE